MLILLWLKGSSVCLGSKGSCLIISAESSLPTHFIHVLHHASSLWLIWLLLTVWAASHVSPSVIWLNWQSGLALLCLLSLKFNQLIYSFN